MTKYDRTIIANFQKGIITEYLVGEGKYFVREHTWGAHDSLYILRALKEWAEESHNLDQISNFLINGFLELEKRNNVENAVYLLNALVYLTTEANDDFYSKVNLYKIADIVVPFFNKNSIKFVQNEWLRTVMIGICDRSPYIKEKLGIL